jgi:hypothetical protein
MFQISEVQESPAFNGRRSFLTLRGFLTSEEDLKFLEEFSAHGYIKADFKIEPILSGDKGKSMMCTIVKIYETTPDLKEIYDSDIRKLFESGIKRSWVVIFLTHDQLKTTSIAKQALKAELKLKRISDFDNPPVFVPG